MLTRFGRAVTAVAVVFGVLTAAAPGVAAAAALTVVVKNQQSGLCLRDQDALLISDCYGTTKEMNWEFLAQSSSTKEYRQIRSFAGLYPSCVDTDGTRVHAPYCQYAQNPVWVVVRYEPVAPPAGMAGLRLENRRTRLCLDTNPNTAWGLYPNKCSNFSPSQQWNIPLDAYTTIFG